MEAVFLKLLNMSITATWIVLAVVVLRFLLKKAPKELIVVMWALVGIRLVCPFSFESMLSLIPSTETVPQDILYSEAPMIHSGIPALNSTVNPIISEELAPAVGESVNPVQVITHVASIVWIVGIIAMFVYSLISYLRLRYNVKISLLNKDNIYFCDNIDTPFILGILKPRIYLPSGISEEQMKYVVEHEKAHLKRKDHFWKPLGFILLSVYWFNPAMWLAYVLLCRDIELACDEKVIKNMDNDAKKGYSEVLVSCSVQRRMIMACPLAFGEVGVKDRIKSVLNYKKPAFWIVIVAVVASIAVAVCFLTNPKGNKILGIGSQKSGSDLDGVSIEIVSADLSAPDPFIEVKWTNETSNSITYGEEFYVYQNIDGKWEDCRINDDFTWNSIGYPVSSGGTSEKKYALNGMIMTQTGKYRFETDCLISGMDPVEYKLWIEFDLTQGVAGITVHVFDPVELVYDHGMYSFVQTAEMAPTYRIVNNMKLYEITASGIATPLGKLEDIELDNNNFDSRFSTSDYSWFNGNSLDVIKKNNKRAWELHSGNGDEHSHLYLLLEQNDGTFYLGFGYYNSTSTNPQNTDDSHIRWLYRLDELDSGSGTAIDQPAVDGAIYFYPEATLQTDIPEYEKFYQMSDIELTELLDILKEQKWHNDNLTDRIAFNFDGQIYYDSNWIYFGYEQGVFYYDEDYCEVTDDVVAKIKNFASKADDYIPIKDVSIAGGVDGYSKFTTETLDNLKKKYPQYFGLNKSKGLEVYVWQLSANSYSCGLLPGRNIAYSNEELWGLESTTMDEMRTIVRYYNIPQSDVVIHAIGMPYSSYSYEINDAYQAKIEEMFWSGYSTIPVAEYSAVIDTTSFDIDDDGINEKCSIGYGPTSGLFTFTISAVEEGTSKSTYDYFNIFTIGGAFDLSFVEDENGKVQVRAESYDDSSNVYYFDISVVDEYITLSENGKNVSYWGGQSIFIRS